MKVSEIEKQVAGIIRKYIGKNARIYLFGSWAKGNAKPTSDIDIAIKISKQERQKFYKIREEVNELRTLRKIDIVDLSLASEKFRKHIFKYALPL